MPPITDLDVVTSAITISDKESFDTARELLKAEGILAGSSTGTLVAAALQWCKQQTEPKRVATFVCDHGSKYLGKMFNDYWMLDQGFQDRKTYGNLRDLISRRHERKEDHTLSPNIPLIQAIKTMRLYDISQLAVVDKQGTVVGIIDESDVLLAVTKNKDNFVNPCCDFMTTDLDTIDASASIDELVPLFAEDKVAIVLDDDNNFLGLITKIDLINHLRRQLPR